MLRLFFLLVILTSYGCHSIPVYDGPTDASPGSDYSNIKGDNDTGAQSDGDGDTDSDTDTDTDTDSDSDVETETGLDAGADTGDDIDGDLGSDTGTATGDTDSDTGDEPDAGEDIDTATEKLGKFSFFVTSLAALRNLSGSDDGFGGDLRFGETGPGAGLRGADKICATIAERSMPGSSIKKWHAFLSATADENGKQVNAIDRIKEGPWYDRLGRLVASNKAALLHERPADADPAIKNDLPNEDGVPNHAPNGSNVDNHLTMTGSNSQGMLYGPRATCKDWTSAKGGDGRPRAGLSWPRIGWGGGGGRGNWISDYSLPGCAAGVYLMQTGGALPGEDFVGSGGGYGGFYCFASIP